MSLSSARLPSQTLHLVPAHACVERWLALAWVGWSLLTLLSLIDFITSIHAYLIDVQTLCHPGTCVPGQPTPETAQTLHQFGLSVGTYAATAVGLVIVSGVVSAAVAAVIIWRKPNDWMVLLVSSTLITQGVFENNYLQGFFDNACIALAHCGPDVSLPFPRAVALRLCVLSQRAVCAPLGGVAAPWNLPARPAPKPLSHHALCCPA